MRARRATSDRTPGLRARKQESYLLDTVERGTCIVGISRFEGKCSLGVRCTIYGLSCTA